MILSDADVVRNTEGNTGSAITRALTQSGVVEDPEHVRKLLAREPGGLGFGRRLDTAGPHREDEESKPMMHEPERSDSAIVARKPANKAGRPAAEPGGRRAGAEGNAGQQSTCRAQNRESVSQALDRVRYVAVIGCLSLNTFGRSRMP